MKKEEHIEGVNTHSNSDKKKEERMESAKYQMLKRRKVKIETKAMEQAAK